MTHTIEGPARSTAQETAAIAAAIAASETAKDPPYPTLAVGTFLSFEHAYGGSVSAVALVTGYEYATPIWVPAATPIDRIGVNVTVAAAGGKVLRFGLRAPIAGTLLPGTLTVDAGTVLADVTGVRAATVSQTLPAGLSILTVSSDGSPTVNFGFGASFDYGQDATGAIKGSPYKAAAGAFPGSYGTPDGYWNALVLLLARLA